MTDELTQLVGVELEDTRNLINTVVYEVADVEKVSNGGGTDYRFTLEKVEGRKRNDERTHWRPELREMINEGSYEIVEA